MDEQSVVGAIAGGLALLLVLHDYGVIAAACLALRRACANRRQRRVVGALIRSPVGFKPATYYMPTNPRGYVD